MFSTICDNILIDGQVNRINTLLERYDKIDASISRNITAINQLTRLTKGVRVVHVNSDQEFALNEQLALKRNQLASVTNELNCIVSNGTSPSDRFLKILTLRLERDE